VTSRVAGAPAAAVGRGAGTPAVADRVVRVVPSAMSAEVARVETAAVTTGVKAGVARTAVSSAHVTTAALAVVGVPTDGTTGATTGVTADDPLARGVGRPAVVRTGIASSAAVHASRPRARVCPNPGSPTASPARSSTAPSTSSCVP